MRDRFRLRRACGAVGELARVDLALMLLEFGNVGIAEHRKAVRSQSQAFAHRGKARFDRLQGQSIDQVDIDRSDAGEPQEVDGPLGVFQALRPVDRLLHVAVEALHAEAGTRDAGLAERFGNGAGEAARVDLDRNLGALGNLEVAADRLHQSQELVAGEDGRRAAAEMNVGRAGGSGRDARAPAPSPGGACAHRRRPVRRGARHWCCSRNTSTGGGRRGRGHRASRRHRRGGRGATRHTFPARFRR